MLRKKQLAKDNNSRTSSRAGLAAQTPLFLDDSDYEDDHEDGLAKLTELLNNKLESIQVAQELENKEDRPSGDIKQYNILAFNRARIQSLSTSINEIIAALQMPRTEVSSLSRELLLIQLYRLTVSKALLVHNDESSGRAQFVDEDKISRLQIVFTLGNYRLATEFLWLFKLLVALICSNIEDFGEFVSQPFTELLEKLITSPPTSVITNANKANVISGLVCLTLIMQNGALSFGIDDRITWLLEIAEGFCASAILLREKLDAGDREHATFITDKHMDKRLEAEASDKIDAEIDVCSSALHGVACLMTLMPRGQYLNEFIQDMLLKVVPIVENDEIRDVLKAAGRVVALAYEMFDYNVQEEDADEEEDSEYNMNAPYYEQGALMATFERLVNLLSKRVLKKDKKDSRLVFRNILHTLEAYTNKEKRIAMHNGSEEGAEIRLVFMDNTHIKLSKYRTLPIHSWYLYSRLRILRWCFSFGLHNQLISNESVRDCLVEPEGEFTVHTSRDYGFDSDDDSGAHDAAAKGKFHESEKQRSDRVKRERANKLADQIEELELSNTAVQLSS